MVILLGLRRASIGRVLVIGRVLFIGKNDLAAELKQMPKGRAMKDFAPYAVTEGDLDFWDRRKYSIHPPGKVAVLTTLECLWIGCP